MFATIRRYESVDQARTDELIKKADETPRAEPRATCPASVATT